MVELVLVVSLLDSPLRALNQHTAAQLRWLAIALILAMIAALIYTGHLVIRGLRGTARMPAPTWERFLTPVLALIGISLTSLLIPDQTPVAKAGLAPVESCAAMGSPYGRLLDIFPVTVMGWHTYSIVFWAGLWALPRSRKTTRNTYRGILGLTVAGTVFSLYLTYLDAFVIKAACWQCLLSASIMTLLMIVAVVPALQSPRRSSIPVLKGSWRKKGLFSHGGRGPTDRY